MAKELRVGIAGVGFIGRVHARSARLAGARIVGVAASTKGSARAAAKAVGADRAFATAEDLMHAEDIDVVHICTPNNLHAPLVQAALAAGKHVVCEKPLAVDVRTAAAMTAAAADAGVMAAVPFVYRYYPMVREAVARARSGQLGPVRLVHGTYLQDWLLSPDDNDWRVDAQAGGPSRAFADIGSHWCDLAEFICGHRIIRLSAATATAHPVRQRRVVNGQDGDHTHNRVETEDMAMVQFETDQGAVGSAVISQISPGRKNRLWLEIDGDHESIVFDQENPETLWCGRRNAVTLLRRDPAFLSQSAARFATLPAGHPQGYADCFDAFVSDVYQGIAARKPIAGLPLFDDGLRAAQVTSAVLNSARAGTWVEVEATAYEDATA